MEKKMDTIISSLIKMEQRLDGIEKEICKNSTKLGEIEKKLNLRCDSIEEQLKEVVDKKSFEHLKVKVKLVEESFVSESNTIAKISDQVLQLDERFTKFRKETENDLLAKELYDKRFNLLVHGIDENKEMAWETRIESEEKLRKFLAEGLQIPSSHAIAIADVHRLPQHAISKQGKRVTRPIIVKLTSYNDKNLIMKSLKNLKKFNAERKEKYGCDVNYIFVTEHLPKEVLLQKKRLIPVFKQAKQLGKKVMWKFEQ